MTTKKHPRKMHLAILGGMSLSALSLASAAVIADDDGSTFPAGGSGWGGNWTVNSASAASDGSVINLTQTGLRTDSS